MSEEEKYLVFNCAVKTLKGQYPSINSFELIDWVCDNIR